ncbi:mycofactocin oligosaccharide methyltransferase MftM [Gordonia sp. NB41Y]|uniref:mycofactocin oligosaccharide methyltransferase MftM n=1 Tax=Gordonia sp. NB41Y TaxID=875808 RepID=UPI0002BF5692|nr:mycofactocin oligosaccharide methyltransferase MftM [Gordonia sp. NB41Y]WLP91278.1 mycofactocin oligosaccharide methyltransferase MftM [Gordonia sp. NB41Y]
MTVSIGTEQPVGVERPVGATGQTPARRRIRVRAARPGERLGGTGPLAWHVGQDDGVELVHRFTTADICDDVLVGALTSLIDIGVLSGRDDFETVAVRIVETCAGTVDRAWSAFYDNTLRSLEHGGSAFAPIHRRARALIEGRSVLEVGSCFGFLALQLAHEGKEVSACDVDPGAVAMLRRAAARRRVHVRADVGDATDLGYSDDSVDTVTLVHLLEHLTADQALTAIEEALRVARRRVIVAVPFEEQPSEHFGHVQALTADDLRSWAGRVRHGGARVFVDHGGWLVLRPRMVGRHP